MMFCCNFYSNQLIFNYLEQFFCNAKRFRLTIEIPDFSKINKFVGSLNEDESATDKFEGANIKN